MPVSPPPVTTASTFDDVVERVYADWLHGADEQPVFAPLVASVSNSSTTWELDLSVLTPDETALLSPGVLVECEYEQAIITAVSGPTITLSRGRNGTVAAAHDGDTLVSLGPSYRRQTVLDAVLDEVVRLYPSLHADATATVVTNSTFVEAPAGIDTITQAYVESGGRFYQTPGVSLLTNFPPSSTGKAFQFTGIGAGKTVHIAYRGAFLRPSSSLDTLEDFDIDPAWVPILCVGATASLVAAEDVDKVTVEWMSRQLEAEQFPTGSGQRLRDSLLRYREYLIEQARRRQRSGSATPVVYVDAYSRH